MAREMTVKRGMTRLKTIKAELNDCLTILNSYSAVCSTEKCRLGIGANDTTTVTVKETIDVARGKIASVKQKMKDLISEQRKITLAIAKSNLETKITVQDMEMTVYEALLFKNNLLKVYSDIVTANKNAQQVAESRVENFNYNSKIEDPSTGKKIEAQVVNFISADEIQSYAKYNSAFMEELNGELDCSNAVTILHLD